MKSLSTAIRLSGALVVSALLGSSIVACGAADAPGGDVPDAELPDASAASDGARDSSPGHDTGAGKDDAGFDAHPTVDDGGDAGEPDSAADADSGNSVDGGHSDAGVDGGHSDAGVDGGHGDAGVDSGHGDSGASVCNPGAFHWVTSVTTSNGATNVSLIWPAPQGGLTGEILLFSGQPSQLAHLPIVTNVSGTIGQKPTYWGFVDVGPTEYWLLSGTLSLTQVSTPLSSEIKATLTNLVFQATNCPDSNPCTFVAGDCLSVALDDVDTTVAIGQPCGSVNDCGSGNQKVCDVPTSTCHANECTSDPDCGAGKVCIVQQWGTSANGNLAGSACYAHCDPAVSGACGASAECTDSGTGAWICMPTGTGTSGSSCHPAASTNSTGCVAGLTCHPDDWTNTSTCDKRCDRFAANPGCATTERCLWDDACAAPLTGVEPVAVGQNCSSAGHLCADDGKAYRGTCVSDFLQPNSPPVCKRVCDHGSTCPGGAACSFDGHCP